MDDSSVSCQHRRVFGMEKRTNRGRRFETALLRKEGTTQSKRNTPPKGRKRERLPQQRLKN